MRVLQTDKRCDETRAMPSRPSDMSDMEELRTLVQHLRQQLADKDKQIAELQRRLGQSGSDETAPAEAADSASQPDPGSREDLFAQLDQLYQER